MTAGQLPRELADAIESAGERLGAFRHVHWIRDVGSTNDVASSLAAAGALEGTSVAADQQHAGLYLSVIVRPGRAEWLSLATLAAGVAVARALTSVSALPLGLKWPNDLVIGQPWRKVGGVLCESAGSGAEIDALIVGIGVNLAITAIPPELADVATSIEAELGRPVDRSQVVVEVLAELNAIFARLRSGGRAWVCDEWRRFGRRGLLGARVRWDDQGIERSGLARDLDESGALLVESAAGIERLIAGEVHWDRPASRSGRSSPGSQAPDPKIPGSEGP
jgi:BirA family biotin operon repressor/biotin-[acetyl-CoA-carboxylase] ligase